MEKIIVILISILLTISSGLLINSNPQYIYLRILGYGIIIIYLIIKLIQKKPIKIIKNKLDICVILLVISTMIPILFNTYVSLIGTIQTILQYIYVLGIYIILREITTKEKGINKIISNTLIITTIILILIGIDDITTKSLTNLLKFTGIDSFLNGEDRLISIFGYSNTLAAYIASILFLNINEYLKQENKQIKIIYKTITYLFIIGIILTYSKGVFLILPILMLIYILKVKDKNKIIEITQNVVISTLMAIIYVTIFEKLENHILLWLLLVISTIIMYLINFIIEGKKTQIDEKQIKKIILFFGISVIIFLIYIVVNLKIYDEYEVFSNDKQLDYDAKVIDNILGDTKYIFEFNIESKAPNDLEDAFKINIIERDSRNLQIANTEISFGTYIGIKNLELTTHKETSEVKIEFHSKYEEKTLIVKELKINGKEICLQYKYLPTKLVEKIKNINIKYKTSIERITIIKDTFKLAKEQFLTGIGGDGWKFKYGEIQEYNYIVTKIHSYPAKVMLEFGVMGIIAYLGIAVILIKILIRNQNIETISILFALIMIALHSIIDVDMEYIHVLLYSFMLLAILSKNLEEKEYKISPVFNILLIGIMCVSVFLTLNTKIYNKEIKISELITSRNGLKLDSIEYKEINNQIAKQYEEVCKYERYNQIQTYYNIIRYYLNSDSQDIKEKIEEYYEKIVQYNDKNDNDIKSIMSKIIYVDRIIKELEEQNKSEYSEIIDKFKQIIIKEYDTTLERLEQCLEKQYIDIDNNIYIDELKEISNRNGDF